MPETPGTNVDRKGAPMRVVRAATTTSDIGETEKFTGQVWLDVLHPADNTSEDEGAGPAYHVYRVHFEPSARTHWHSHPQGQVLYVLSGRGRVGDESGVEEVLPGDAVHTAPGQLHWHGAVPDAFMVHLAISGAGESTWNGEVTREQYEKPPATQGPARRRQSGVGDQVTAQQAPPLRRRGGVVRLSRAANAGRPRTRR